MRISILVACLWLATSPLHAQIVFLSLRTGNWEIYKMDSNGRNKARLTRNEADEYSPVWAPNGKQIAFESYRDKNWDIYVMDADGGNQRNLTQHPAIDSFPALRTGTGRRLDGRRCLYLKDLTVLLFGALTDDLYSLHMRLLATRISTATGLIIKN